MLPLVINLTTGSSPEAPGPSPEAPGPCEVRRINCSVNHTQLTPSWCLDANGTARYTADQNGTLFRRTLSGFQKCLGNKHVVFVGDSRTRYQFMSLVHFLVHREWLKCHDYFVHNPSKGKPKPECLFIFEKMPVDGQRFNWSTWFNTSAADHNLNGGREACHCYRKTSGPIYENHFFEISTKFGLIRLTMLLCLTDLVYSHPDFPPFGPLVNQSRCLPGTCSHQANRHQPTNVWLREVVAKLKPTHLLASTGWTTIDRGCDLVKLERETGIVTMYITHPATRGQVSHNHRYPTQGCQSRIFDRETPTLGVPAHFYWDELHLLSMANEELNHILVSELCGDPQEVSRVC